MHILYLYIRTCTVVKHTNINAKIHIFVYTSGFVRGLTKESSELSLASLKSAGGAEAGKRSGRGDEGVVGVEAVGRAVVFVAVEKHFLEELFGNDVADVSLDRRRRWKWGRGRRRGALAMAMISVAVGAGGATISVVAATHPLRAASAASFISTFAVGISTGCQQ